MNGLADGNRPDSPGCMAMDPFQNKRLSPLDAPEPKRRAIDVWGSPTHIVSEQAKNVGVVSASEAVASDPGFRSHGAAVDRAIGVPPTCDIHSFNEYIDPAALAKFRALDNLINLYAPADRYAEIYATWKRSPTLMRQKQEAVWCFVWFRHRAIQLQLCGPGEEVWKRGAVPIARLIRDYIDSRL